ncbi:MAG: hypothetical protein IPK28_20475 [Devosia sp.]|nr:hypothetical protein [Devosia sp.]
MPSLSTSETSTMVTVFQMALQNVAVPARYSKFLKPMKLPLLPTTRSVNDTQMANRNG